jgi:uncharacterized protein with ParB-like and HNH nuclease domain
MKAQKYSVNQHLIETVLSWVKSGEIAIPEIQRPFVWDSSKERRNLNASKIKNYYFSIKFYIHLYSDYHGEKLKIIR